MELDSMKALNKAIASIEKCNKAIEEMRSIDNRRRSLEEKIAKAKGKEKERLSKGLLGLGKVLESMQEQVTNRVSETGKQLAQLKPLYRQRAPECGAGEIAEAVPE